MPWGVKASAVKHDNLNLIPGVLLLRERVDLPKYICARAHTHACIHTHTNNK